jgi:hypothetical protein
MKGHLSLPALYFRSRVVLGFKALVLSLSKEGRERKDNNGNMAGKES